MMIQEFEQLTGIYPTTELYKVIEKKYMDGPWTSKQEFCEAYKANKDGLAESCARCANENTCYPNDLTELMEKYNTDWWESDFAHIGKRIDQRVVLWAVGYQMAMQQIKE